MNTPLLLILLGLLLALCAFISRKLWRYYQNDYSARNRRINKHSIVFAGTSRTQQMPLYNRFRNKTLVNLGQSWIKSNVVLRNIEKSAKCKPAVIVVEMAINDILNDVPLAQIAEYFEQAIATIRKASPATKIYLCSLFPAAGDFARVNPKISETNTCLKNLALQSGVRLIDTSAGLAINGALISDYTTDGLHLNAKGNDILMTTLSVVFTECHPTIR